MKYNFQNEAVNEIFEFYSNVKEAKEAGQNPMDMLDIKEITYNIIAAYAIDVLDIAEDTGEDLNLKYDTLNKLPKVMTALWRTRAKTLSVSENRDSFAKSMAAYLTFLAVNEHDAGIYGTIDENLSSDKIENLWADLVEISFGNREHSIDLLPVCKKSIKNNSHLMPQGVMIDIVPVRQAYASITGVDLAEHRLMSIAIES